MEEVDERVPLSQLIEKRQEFLNFLVPRVSNREDAEDILQAAYIKGLESELEELESPVAWFYRVLRNSIVDTYRRRDSARRGSERFATEASLEPAAEIAIESVACKCVEVLLGTLNPPYAQIISDIDLGEASITDFASAEGIEPNNARVRLHRARRSLRSTLLAACGVCAEHGCLDCDCL